MRKNDRGFSVYAEDITEDRERVIKLIESSEVGDPRCHVFVQESPLEAAERGHKKRDIEGVLYLSVANAKQVIEGLQAFVTEAESPDYWRNASEYVMTFLVG